MIPMNPPLIAAPVLKKNVLIAATATCSVLAAASVNKRTYADSTIRDKLSQTRSTWKGSGPVVQQKKESAWPKLPELPYASLPDFPGFPDWAWPTDLLAVKDKISLLLVQLGRGPTSLYAKIIETPQDLDSNPECAWEADVRLGDGLPASEKAFLRERRRQMKAHFAKFIGADESDVDEQDIPIVAVAGSGGGYRAMFNTIGSLIGAEKTGFLNCTTYVAGISGSCWALGSLYSQVYGSSSPATVARHLVKSIQTSYLDVDVLDSLTSEGSGQYLLAGLIRKATAGSLSITDIYGTLISSRLLVNTDPTFTFDASHLSLSKMRNLVKGGQTPLPIFTAVSHAIPPEEKDSMVEPQTAAVWTSRYPNTPGAAKEPDQSTEDSSRWLWFEYTPFEVGCDTLGAWIPSWATGRKFKSGKSIDRSPELSLTILEGIFASAFCASLYHYVMEIKPIMKTLPVPLCNWLDGMISQHQTEMSTIHPIIPNQVNNFVKGMAGQLKPGAGENISEDDTIGLMDAGAVLNIPYYPFLRRNVDCIVALDASADSQDLWFTRAEEYAVKRGLKSWPKGAKWPAELQIDGASQSTGLTVDENSASEALAKVQERELASQTAKEVEQSRSDDGPSALSGCMVWIGSTKDDGSPTRVSNDMAEEELALKDGIGIVYIPLLPNEKAVDGFDPLSVSTWRRELQKEESEKLLAVAEANFLEGSSALRKLLRAMWIRKRQARVDSESPSRT